MTRPALLIGRFQPPHKGHLALIRTLLEENKTVIIAIMDTPFSADNPYNCAERVDMFRQALGIHARVSYIVIPWISEIVYGRTPGYDIRQIHLDPDIEAVSATAIRAMQKPENGS